MDDARTTTAGRKNVLTQLLDVAPRNELRRAANELGDRFCRVESLASGAFHRCRGRRGPTLACCVSPRLHHGLSGMLRSWVYCVSQLKVGGSPSRVQHSGQTPLKQWTALPSGALRPRAAVLSVGARRGALVVRTVPGRRAHERRTQWACARFQRCERHTAILAVQSDGPRVGPIRSIRARVSDQRLLRALGMNRRAPWVGGQRFAFFSL